MKLAKPFLFCLALLCAGTAAAQDFQADLEGSQVVGPVVTGASGIGTFTLDGSKVLSYSITFEGLESAETGAHIHGAAPIGVNAGVLYVLPLGSPKNGTIGPLTPQEEADLKEGLWYVQIHTTGNPGGELRGQILPQLVPTEPTTWGRVKRLFDR